MAEQQLAAALQGHAAQQGSAVAAALAAISAELAHTACQVDVDSNSPTAMIAQGWQTSALRQVDQLDEMQLASAALANMIAV